LTSFTDGICHAFSIIFLAGCQTSSHDVSEEAGGISRSAYKAFTDNSPKNGYPDYRAFFYSKTNDAFGFSYDYSSVEEAINRAREECAQHSGDCQIFSVGDIIVYEKGPNFLRTSISKYSDSVSPEK